MRIGIDGRLWNETGVGRYIRNLVLNLQKIDKKNEYVLFVKEGVTVPLSDEARPRWEIVTTNIRWHTLSEQIKFPKILEKEKLDLVHFPYFSIPIFYKRPYVITIHDLIINHYSTGKASTLPYPLYYLKYQSYRHIIKTAAKKAQKIITVSEATKAEILKTFHVPQDKVIVTYEGFDGHIAGSSQKPLYKNYFLSVGNAYPHKNLERLVDAFALLAQETQDIQLVMVGPDNYFYKRLQEKVRRLNLEKRIILPGTVSDEKLASLYQHAKALIIPSLMEGFGLPGLEAMQHQCLVLASDIPVFKEIYQDAALYFDPLSVEAIHATIRRVLDNEISYESTLKKGLERLPFFSWEKMTHDTVNIYESCIGIRSGK